MNLDDACMYLNISPDDEDLDLDEIKRNYHDKLEIYNPEKFSHGSPEYNKAQEMRRNLDEAYNFLLNAYSQIYGDNNSQNNNNLFLKLAVFSSLVIILCFAVSALLLYKYKSNTTPPSLPPAQNASNAEDYSRILRELEELRAKTQNQPQPQKSPPAPANYADLVERVMPSIVLIETDNSRGSGFFVSSKGEILTNYHVIKNAHNIRVSTKEGRKFNAQIKDYDSKNDMALIIINSGSTPFLRISPVLPRQGESVIAIGNPRGLEGTVSNGIISAFRENNKWVQFTAPISPGSSGGALINLRGEVVGMPTQYMTEGQNLNFAVAPTLLNNFFRTAQNNNNSIKRPQTQKVSRDNKKISLPNSRGFNSIKWNATFSSVESAIKSELESVGESEILFTSGKTYKAFRANLDVKICYAFDNYKLKGVMLVPDISEFNAESNINKLIRELNDIYGSPISRGYDDDGEFNTIWKDSNMAVMLLYQESSSTLIVMFTPFL